MEDPDLKPLEATVAKLTARSPDKLVALDSDRANDRFETELQRQIARLDPEYDSDALPYLDDAVYSSESDDIDDIIVLNAYPRNAGMASGIYQALKARRLPSGATVYFETGEWEGERIRGLAAREMDDEAAEKFGEVIALPTHFHAGGYLLEIDRHLSQCTPGSWMLEALVDREAEWIEQEMLDEGEERRGALQRAIEESWEEGDVDAETLEHEEETLDATPGWFLLLTDAQLDEIAAYELPGSGRGLRLRNKFEPWHKPTRDIFLDPDDPANRQHIVAAYLLAR
jgi:hypothetical protein